MIDIEDYKGLTGNEQMNCLLNDMQASVRVLSRRIKHHDDDIESLVGRVNLIEELIDFAIDNSGVSNKEKPRTKVEYVKILPPCDFFELEGSFKEGNIYFMNIGGSFEEVLGIIGLANNFSCSNLYLRTETTYTWLDEVSEYVDSIAKAADEIKDEELITIEGTFTREQLVKLGEIIKG